MLRALVGFDHCPKNVADTWMANSGMPVTKYGTEAGKSFIVNNAGALSCATGTKSIRTLATFNLTSSKDTITSFVVGFRLGIDVVGNAGTIGYISTESTGQVVITLPTFGSVFPAQVAGQSAYIEVFCELNTGTFATFVNGVQLGSSTVITASLLTALRTGNVYFFGILGTANSPGVSTIRDIYFLDNVVGDGFTQRLGDRVLVPLIVDAATGADYTASGGLSLLNTLNAPVDSSSDYVRSTYANTPLQLSLNGAFPAGVAVQAVQLFLSGKADQDSRVPTKVQPAISLNGKNVSGLAATLPLSMTYGQNLGIFPMAPDGTLWSSAKIDNVMLSITPDT